MRFASYGGGDEEFGVLPSSSRFVCADGSYSFGVGRAHPTTQPSKRIPGQGVTSCLPMDGATPATVSRKRVRAVIKPTVSRQPPSLSALSEPQLSRHSHWQ